MIFDAVMGLCILGILMTLMAVGLSSHQRAALRLANTRAACNAAESALTDLQRGKPPAARQAADRIQIDRLEGGTAVPDFTWVRVTATVAGRRVSLSGLVKASALKGD
jgi:type II secretory pathway pseudopilin PulG